MSQSLPQVMNSIRSHATAVVADLAAAQNAIAALLGQEPTPVTTAIPLDTLPSMLLAVSVEMDATEAAFAELANAVHGWVTGPAISPEAEARMRSRTAELVAALTRQPEPIPEPVNVPVMAGGLNSPSVIDAEDMHQRIAETTPEQEPTPAPTEGDETPEPTLEPDADEDSAHSVNRIAAHLNGHVQGDPLATVLDSPPVLGVESPEAGKRGGRRPRKQK